MLRTIFLWAIVVGSSFASLYQPLIGAQAYLFITHTAMADYVGESGGYKSNNGIVLAGFILLGYLLIEMQRARIPFRRLILVVVLWFLILCSAANAHYTEIAIPAAVEYSKMFLMMIVIAALASSEDRIRKLLYTIAAALGLLGSKGALNTIFTGGHSIVRGPGEGMLADRNDYALALDMGFMLCLILAQSETIRWRKWALRLMGFGCGIASIGTQSRGGALGLAAASALLVLYSKRKLVAVPLAIVAMLLALFVIPPETLDRYRGIENAAETDGSAIGRLQAWETATHMIEARPMLGVGPRNFVYVFKKYSDYSPRAPHNSYIAMAAECGLPACFIFISLLIGTVSKLLWNRRKLLSMGESKLAGYCLAIATTLIVYMVPAMFVGRQQFDLMYNLIAIAIGLLGYSRALMHTSRPAAPEWVQENVQVAGFSEKTAQSVS